MPCPPFVNANGLRYSCSRRRCRSLGRGRSRHQGEGDELRVDIRFAALEADLVPVAILAEHGEFLTRIGPADGIQGKIGRFADVYGIRIDPALGRIG